LGDVKVIPSVQRRRKAGCVGHARGYECGLQGCGKHKAQGPKVCLVHPSLIPRFLLGCMFVLFP
jgi:hypothetical protein